MSSRLSFGGLSKPNKLSHLTGSGEMIFTVLIRRQPGETWTPLIAGEQVEQGGELCGTLGFDSPFSIEKSGKQQARDAKEGRTSREEKGDAAKEVLGC